ncbi:MAG TPA: penicillin-binding transpeptidase domain-containing protein, partial [Thermodesulfobacteriota bacterium]|nr:penicillin-binding transpeptidase domain-containing protein [Thermodesulfobacteriota bacterium]
AATTGAAGSAPLDKPARPAPVEGPAGTGAASAPAPGFPLTLTDWARLATDGGTAVVPLPGGLTARLTLDPALQERLTALLAQARPVAGALVLLDPRDGRLLALTSTTRRPTPVPVALASHYPAASLFKLVTAAAGLEAGTIAPTTTVRTVGGGLRRLRPEHLADNPRRERWAMTLAQALARSDNPVFGKVAVKRVGAERLALTARAFGFDRPIPFDLPLSPSRAEVPDDPLGLGRTGAGFGEVSISPLHAALVAAAIANEGRMPRPWLVERVTDASGRVVYQGGPALLGRPITPRTARALAAMMAETVARGTSRRAFRGFRETYGVDVAGKTGSITGDDPPGHYDWFAGFAPVDEPEVAVAALLVNGPRWHLKGSGAARAALAAYFERAAGRPADRAATAPLEPGSGRP